MQIVIYTLFYYYNTKKIFIFFLILSYNNFNLKIIVYFTSTILCKSIIEIVNKIRNDNFDDFILNNS